MTKIRAEISIPSFSIFHRSGEILGLEVTFNPSAAVQGYISIRARLVLQQEREREREREREIQDSSVYTRESRAAAAAVENGFINGEEEQRIQRLNTRGLRGSPSLW